MKKSPGRHVLAALCLAAFSFSAGGAVEDLGKLIPRTIGDWRASGNDQLYDPKTIYDYMDGGAEVYLAFDFRRLLARKYAGPEEREISLDIFDMGSPEEAYGILSCDREDPPAGIGQDSTYGFGLLRFRQGRYFVSVMAADEDERAGRAALEIGRVAAKALGPPGPAPDMVGLLPGEGLRPDRTSYFHANVSLNNRHFLASENILGLDRTTDCAFAEYDAGSGKPAYLLLIRYPGAEPAAAARRSFLSTYAPEADPEGLAPTENKTWVLAALRDRYLIIVLESPSRDRALELAASVAIPAK